MNDVEGFILLALLILGVVNVFFLLRRKESTGNVERLSVIADRLDVLSGDNEKIREAVDKKLAQVHESSTDQFKEARAVMSAIAEKSDRLIENVNTKLSHLDKTNQQIVGFSEQLQNLQNILKNPKQRGVLGEVILENVLANVLPPDAFAMQHAFSDGEIVDAVVFVKDKVIPIDSKFSMENYERVIHAGVSERAAQEKLFRQDLKNRIDETAKYIRPEEKTTDFAFMFIPSEAIYYDLLTNKVGTFQGGAQSMIEYAFRDRHVVVISPTSFLAYLQTVLQGLRALEIEENAKNIKTNVEVLGKHWLAFDTYMGKLGKTLGTSVGHFNSAYKELSKIDRDVMRITERQQPAISVEEVEKPDQGDL